MIADMIEIAYFDLSDVAHPYRDCVDYPVETSEEKYLKG